MRARGNFTGVASTTTAGLMSAAQAGYLDELQQAYDPCAQFPACGTIGVSCGFTDFAVTAGGIAPYIPLVSGTNAATNWASGDTQRIGILSLDTGTTAAGVAVITSNAAMFRFGGGVCRTIFAGRIPTASDGTDTFTARVGFNDSSALGGDGVDGCFFRYTHSVNGGRWQCVNRSNSVENAMDSGVDGVSAAFQTLEIEVNAAATSVAYRIDGVLVATNTSSIPSGAGRETGLSAHILKSAGTTSRSLIGDFMGHRIVRSANV